MWLHRRATHFLLLLPVLGALLPSRAAGGTVPGEPCGTPMLVRDLASGQMDAAPSELVDVSGKLFFAASDGSPGLDLWQSDGTQAGTVRVKSTRVWPSNAILEHFTAVGARLFFMVGIPSGGTTLWTSDGTDAGTVALQAFPNRSLVAELTAVGDTLYFTADDGTQGVELWKSDGTPAGTRIVLDLVGGSEGSFPSGLAALNGKLLFSAEDGISGAELWTTDGSAGNTLLVKDIWAGSNSSAPRSPAVMDGKLYFVASDGSPSGASLWRSDGTLAGTELVASAELGGLHNTPQELTAAGRTLFFRLDDIVHGEELWKSDGTAAGTVLVKDIQPGSFGSLPDQLTAIDGLVYFMANDSESGREPWRSDGTAAGTFRVRDFIPGSSGQLSPVLAAGPGLLVASIDDGQRGRELWKSDGAKTVLLADISPGNAHADPRSMTLSGGKLFFVAKDPTMGEELFAIPLKQVDCFNPVLTCPGSQQVEAVSAQGSFFSIPPYSVFDDASAAPSVNPSRPLQGLFPMGQTTVTLTARDAAGNTDMCDIQVTVADTTPPLLLCPKAVVQEATSAQGAVGSYFVVASDAVSPPTVTPNHASGSLFPIGETTIQITAKSGADTVSCSFPLTVADTVAPRLVCPQDVVRLATSVEPIVVTYEEALPHDDVTKPSEVTTDHPSGSLFPVGETVVTRRARDAAGNTSQCSFRVNNVDPEAPTIQCPGPQQVVASKPEGGVVDFPEADATDNLGVRSVSYSQDPGSTFAVGETIVTATAADLGGNEASCTFTVTVLEGSGTGCGGCGAGSSGSGLWWLLLALAPLWARRRAVGVKG